MSLQRFTGARLVIQHRRTSAHDAVRAMEANHVGAILVQDERALEGIVTDRDIAIRLVGQNLRSEETPLENVMTPNPATLLPSASERDAAELMRFRGIRRVPLVEGDHVVGLVTLDDLILAGDVDPALLAEVVRAQLEYPSSHKPAGLVGPERRTRTASESGDPAEERFGRMLRVVRDCTELESREAAETAIDIVLGAVVRRITYQEAADLMAQLPSQLQERLLALPDGPDTTIDLAVVESELGERLDLAPDESARVVRGIGVALEQLVSEGELADVCSQLPRDMREIFPSVGRRITDQQLNQPAGRGP